MTPNVAIVRIQNHVLPGIPDCSSGVSALDSCDSAVAVHSADSLGSLHSIRNQFVAHDLRILGCALQSLRN